MDIDTKLGFGLCGIVLAATCMSGVVRPVSKEPIGVKLEQRIIEKIDSKFSDEENKCISDVVKAIKSKYKMPFDVYFIKAKMIGDTMTTGRTFPLLGHDVDTKKAFIENFGKEKYDMLKGKNVVALREIEKWKELDGKKGMWSSIYIPNKYDELYKKCIAHEIFHVYGNRVITKDIENKVVKIDIDSKAYDKDGKNHPAHPSYYTYFYVGFPGSLAAGKHEEKFRKLNSHETFADTMAFYVLGCFDENVKDKMLAQKLEIFKQAMKKYEK